jgi:predicted nucleotide-binding protein (sugar kinase/HSP70/actin superfamily)
MKVRRSLEGAGPAYKDPTFNDIVRFSSPYIGLANNQLLLLNIAKMVEFIDQGADGVINAICFNCMLGTVSAAIASKIRKDYDHVPIPTFVYAGSELTAEKTNLEAFVHQVRQYARRKKRRP